MKKTNQIKLLFALFLVAILCVSCNDLFNDYLLKVQNHYALTFDANGGTGSMEYQSMVSGTGTNLSANTFTRSGYVFSGWATSSNATSANFSDKAIYTIGSSDATLYAVWTKILSITFDANGGTGTMAVQTIVTGASVKLTANAFTRASYTFAGWATSSSATIAAYADSASYTMGSADLTLYAMWTSMAAPTHTITFSANGGTGTMANQTIAEGASVNLTANAFTYSGYHFAGWAPLSTATTGSFADCASYTMGTANVILYAVWTISPTHMITFNKNDGTATSASQSIVEGLSANLIANTFNRTGYTFAGWATSSGNTTVAYTNSASYTMGSSDVILYAVWTGNNYTITFNKNDGTGSTTTQTIACGVSTALTTNAFTLTSFSFAGWATTSGATSATWADGATYTMGTNNVTLYAVWTYNTPSLATLQTGGYITTSDTPAVTDSSYTQATSTAAGFVHNISEFDIGKYLVTYELWYTVRQWAISHSYTFSNAGREGNDGTIGAVPTTTAKLEPVTTVNWRDCIVWCNAYSEMAGKTPVYYSDASFTMPIRSSADGSYGSSVNTNAGSFDNPYIKTTSKGYRLPTEGEYQYAASCNATYKWDYASGADAAYSATTGGSDIDNDSDVQYSGDVAWYSGNSSSKTHDVGTKAANVWGLYDMSGNVFEWCQDWYGNGTLPTTTQDDYTGAYNSTYPYRVLRGGSWCLYTSRLQVGDRYYGYPYVGYGYVGFRVCCGR